MTDDRHSFEMTELIPQAVLESLPAIGHDPATLLADSVVHGRLVDEASGWRWYVLEFDGDVTFFGVIVNRIATVAGQFGLQELAGLSADPGGVHWDAEFVPVTLATLQRSEPGIAEILTDPSPREVNARGLVDLE